MLLALGPLLLDTAVRTVVVGLADHLDAADLAGADAAWLTSPTPERVASLRGAGHPVGVTVSGVGPLRDLVAAGAVAAACEADAAVGAAGDLSLALWCSPAQAVRAVAAGLPAERVVCEPGDPDTATVAGTTVAGAGPAAWGRVVRDVLDGARVVRTDDVAAVRRVVTVLDRLAAARAAATSEATA